MNRSGHEKTLGACLAFLLATAVAAPATRAADPPASGAFRPAAPLRATYRFHTATRLRDGRVLLVDGDGQGSAEVWDPTTESSRRTRSPSVVRLMPTATLLSDGRVLLVGGSGMAGDGAPVAVEVWTPRTGRFGRAGVLPEERSGHTATLLLDGHVLVVGGHGPSDRPMGSALLWDPATRVFSPTGPLAEARSGHTATVLPDGRVLVMGGWGADGALASTEVWDPATGIFEAAEPLPEVFEFHTATPLPDGRILIVGDGGEDPPRGSNLLRDPATGAFVETGPLIERRSDHTATLLAGGRVLVAGGFGRHGVLASAEVWDPATGSFTPTGSLAAPRDGHTATLLPDGRVLVAGGDSGEGEGLASVELWDPALEMAVPDGTPAPTGDHQAPALEQALPVGAFGGESWTSSYVGEAAKAEWDESVLVAYLVGGTCRTDEGFAMATLGGGGTVLALRVPGADTDLLSEAYQQGRRFVGPELDASRAPGFPVVVAGEGWRPDQLTIADRTVLDYGGGDRANGGFYSYVVGDTIFEVWGTAEEVVEVLRRLPAAGSDTSSFGPPVDPPPADCTGLEDAELRAALPAQLDGVPIDPMPLPPDMAAGFAHLDDLPGVPTEGIRGYLLFLTIGSAGGAIRLPQASPAQMEDVCAAIFYDTSSGDLPSREVDGRRVIIAADGEGACYIWHDALFYMSGGPDEFFRSLPLP